MLNEICLRLIWTVKSLCSEDFEVRFIKIISSVVRLRVNVHSKGESSRCDFFLVQTQTKPFCIFNALNSNNGAYYFSDLSRCEYVEYSSADLFTLLFYMTGKAVRR